MFHICATAVSCICHTERSRSVANAIIAKSTFSTSPRVGSLSLTICTNAEQEPKYFYHIAKRPLKVLFLDISLKITL